MTATDSAHVLRCTFCGSANFRRPMQDPWQKWIIGCVDCGAEGPQADSPSEAIAAWNSRPESADDALLREARNWLSSIGLPGGVTDELRDRIDAHLSRPRPARDEALEEAAKVAEHYNFGPERTERDNARNATAQIIATAIRALQGQKP